MARSGKLPITGNNNDQMMRNAKHCPFLAKNNTPVRLATVAMDPRK